MSNTRCALAAAILVWALPACASPEEVQTEQKPAGVPTLVGPASPSGWYTGAEFENALQAAETLGQPLAVMYQETCSTCPLHNGQRDAWLRAMELTAFVRVVVDTADPAQPELVQKFRRDAGERAGRFIPMLFLGTRSGELLGVVPYQTPPPQCLAIVGEALKTFGGVLPPKTAIELWRRLELARAHWENGKTDAALKCYLVIKREEGKNPKLPIFAELRKDEEQINQKGAEEVAAAQALLDQGQLREARTAVATIRRRYAMFKPAEDAKTLLATAGTNDRTAADAPPVQDPPAMRTWSDASGQHKIEAELASVKDDQVRLKKAGGESLSVPLSRLSADDQKYVQRWLAKHGSEQADNGHPE